MAVDKIVDGTALDNNLTSVANAIRTKGGTSGSLSFPSGFVSAIGNLGGGGQELLDLVASNITINSSTMTPTSFNMSSAHQSGDAYYAEILSIGGQSIASGDTYSSNCSPLSNSVSAIASRPRLGSARADMTMTNGSNAVSVSVSQSTVQVATTVVFNLYRLR